MSLDTLRGHTIVFTGALQDARRVEARRALRAGATVRDDVTSSTTVVVLGRPSPHYKYGQMGVKLRQVEHRRKRGQLIYVINEQEFRRLLIGSSLSSAAQRAARSGLVTPLGLPYRPPPLPLSDRGVALTEIDLDMRERRRQEHERMVKRIAHEAQAWGYAPLRLGNPACAYDIGWHAGATFHVVEVKTTRTGDDERHQVRLGLGQVLHYRTWLRQFHRSVRAHLVVSKEPDQLLGRTCDAARVDLVSVTKLERLFVRSGG